jgi:hypothetical protein
MTPAARRPSPTPAARRPSPTPAARALAVAAIAALLAAPSLARAAGPAPGAPAAADLLVDAGAALSAGDHARAASLAERVARDQGPIARADRAEAWRILGLAQHALGRRSDAARSFYAYLRLDPDARLDPALVPPQVLSFFEEVRAQHAAELAALRPRPRRKPTLWLNFVPLGGQWQNGDRTKMWILGSAGLLLAGANITSYAMLRSWCGSPGRSSTCDEGEPGQPGYVNHADAARRMQAINIVSGVGLLALYTYSVVDGLYGYRQWRQDERDPGGVSVGVGAAGDSLLFTVAGGF